MMKLKLPRRRVWRVALYILSIVLVLAAIDLVLIQLGRRISIGYDTTRITEPTMPGGPIDYLAALENYYSQGVTPQNNAVPLMLEAFGRAGLAKNQPRDGITTRLGMPPLPEAGAYYQHRDKFPDTPTTKALDAADQVNELPQRPWKATDRPLVAAWLKENEKPLAKLAEASRRTRFFYPFNAGYRPETMIELQVPYLQLARQSSRALVTRALMRAGSDDAAGALEDLLTVHRLARLIAQGPIMLDRLVGYAVEDHVSDAEQAIAADGTLTAAQAREWMKAIHDVPPMNSFVDSMGVSERYMFLDAMQFGARHGAANFLRTLDSTGVRRPDFYWGVIPIRFAQAMRVANDWYDRLSAAGSKPTRVERHRALEALDQELASSRSKGNISMMISSEWPLQIFFPNLTAIASRYDAVDAHRAMTQAALALAAYHAERRTYPRSLDALKPDYLAEVPVDPFSEKPLVYRASKDGYVLYSVGLDRSDDNGALPIQKEDKGDLVLRAGDQR
jgi:hypothetical protein